jgi:hypothetical protein
VTINGRGKDHLPNGLGDEFQDLWYNNLVQAQAIRASFMLESITGFDRLPPLLFVVDNNLTKEVYSPLSHLSEQGLFEPEQGEGQMWGQRNSKYAAVVGTQLLSKIHCLELQLRDIGHLQNHPVDKLQEQVDFIRDATDRVGRVVDELNNQINLQDVQIEQLANMVNNLVGKTQAQEKEIKNLKADRESHCKGEVERRMKRG